MPICSSLIIKGYCTLHSTHVSVCRVHVCGVLGIPDIRYLFVFPPPLLLCFLEYMCVVYCEYRISGTCVWCTVNTGYPVSVCVPPPSPSLFPRVSFFSLLFPHAITVSAHLSDPFTPVFKKCIMALGIPPVPASILGSNLFRNQPKKLV